MVNIYLDCENPPAATKTSDCEHIVEWQDAGISHSTEMTGGDGNPCTGGYVRGSKKHHRSGNRCIELIINDVSLARRAELKLYGLGTVTHSWGMFWVMFENGYTILGSQMDSHICQPVYEPSPDYHLSIRINWVSGTLRLVFARWDPSDGHVNLGSSPIVFPIGEWVQIIYYVKRATSGGILRVWQNHQLVFQNTNLKTSEGANSQIMHQCYLGTNEDYPKASYRDDIYHFEGENAMDPGWDDINKPIIRGYRPTMNIPEMNCPFPLR